MLDSDGWIGGLADWSPAGCRSGGQRCFGGDEGGGEGAGDLVAAGVPEVPAEMPVPTVFAGQMFGLAEFFEDGFGGFGGESEFEAVFDVVFRKAQTHDLRDSALHPDQGTRA